MRSSARIFAFLLLGGLAVQCSAAPTAAVFRSFDGPELTWKISGRRAGSHQILAHGCVADDARQGSRSERVVIKAPGGESMHFTCEVGRVPVLEEFEARLWVKANRPGAALAARVVLPRAIDATTGRPRTALVSGDECVLPNRWQQLRLANVTDLLAAEARVMRASLGAAIDTREAYVDAMVLVVPGGPDRTAVWTDGLEIDGIVIPPVTVAKRPAIKVAKRPVNEPVLDPQVRPTQHWQMAQSPPIAPPAAPIPAAPSPAATSPQVKFQGATLLVDGRPFLPLGIEWNGEPIPFLAARGFNTIWLDKPPLPEQTADATRVNAWFVCKPPKPEAIDELGLGDSLDRVLAWNLGSPVGPHELDYFRRWADTVRDCDSAGRPIIIAPRGDWMPTSRHADVLVAEHAMGTRLTGTDFVKWFATLQNLARPGTPLWASIPTQPGPRARQQVSLLAPDARLEDAALDELEMKSLTLAAATNGCRGFVMRSNSPLHAADEATKRRAVIVETLNNELAMLAPWLTIGKRMGEATSTDAKSSADLLQVERARLLMPSTSSGPTTETNTVSFIVPGIPVSNQAYLLSPALMQSLPSKRVAGGTRVELDPNSVLGVLLTEDLSVITGFRQRVASGGRRAAQLQYSLAVSRLRILSAASPQLASHGIDTKSLDQSLGSANTEIGKVNIALTAGKVDLAYSHAAAARSILGSAYLQVEAAVNDKRAMQSTPFSQSDESLLTRLAFEKSIASLREGENQLAGGDFEDLGQLQKLGWQHIDDPIAGINSQVKLSAKSPREGRYSLELSALPATASAMPQVVARPLVWITSPPVQVKAGDVVEITGWVRTEQPIKGSIAGLTIIDSLGGPELALSVRSTNDWQPFRLVRGASDTTEMTLTFALEGIGAASLDNVMIRSLAAPSVKRLPEVTSQPGPSFPNTAGRSLFGPPLER